MVVMPLAPTTIALLSSMMQAVAAMYAIVFVVYQIQWGHFSAKNIDRQTRDGIRYYRSFNRVAFAGANVVLTVALCAYAIDTDVDEVASWAKVWFYFTLLQLGYIVVAEAYSSSAASLMPRMSEAAFEEYFKRHPDMLAQMVGKAGHEIGALIVKDKEAMDAALKVVQREIAASYVPPLPWRRSKK